VNHLFRAIRVKFSEPLAVSWPKLHRPIAQIRRPRVTDARLKRLPDPNSIPAHDRVPAAKKLPAEHPAEKVRQFPDNKRFERISGTAQTDRQARSDLTCASFIANAMMHKNLSFKS